MSDDFKPSDITIIAPRRSTMPRGVHTTKKNSPTRSIRISDEEYETIMAGATACDMTWAEFTRWVSLYAANDVLKQKRLHGYK